MPTRIKRIILISIIMFMSSIPCYSLNSISEEAHHPEDNSPVISSISLQFGRINGVTREQVYSYDKLISQLDWEMNPVYFAGATFNTQFFQKYYLNLGYWTGLNSNIGKVRDYDYTNGSLTHFSEQDCIQEKIQMFDANTEYTYNIFTWFGISAVLGYNYTSFKMLAHDGYLQYPPGSAPQAFYGTGVVIEQVFNIPYIGLGGTIQIKDVIYLQVFGMYSHFVFCDETDYHIRRSIEVYSTADLGQYISIIGSLGWKINNYTSLVFTAQYMEIRTSRGSSYYTDLSTGIKSPSAAGTSAVRFNDTSLRFSVEHSLRWIL